MQVLPADEGDLVGKMGAFFGRPGMSDERGPLRFGGGHLDPFDDSCGLGEILLNLHELKGLSERLVDGPDRPFFKGILGSRLYFRLVPV